MESRARPRGDGGRTALTKRTQTRGRSCPLAKRTQHHRRGRHRRTRVVSRCEGAFRSPLEKGGYRGVLRPRRHPGAGADPPFARGGVPPAPARTISLGHHPRSREGRMTKRTQHHRVARLGRTPREPRYETNPGSSGCRAGGSASAGSRRPDAWITKRTQHHRCLGHGRTRATRDWFTKRTHLPFWQVVALRSNLRNEPTCHFGRNWLRSGKRPPLSRLPDRRTRAGPFYETNPDNAPGAGSQGKVE
jgi:hypothetical protein